MTDPGLTPGQIPTADQWNSYFAAKADITSGAIANPEFTGAMGGIFTITNNPGYVATVTDGFTSGTNAKTMTFSGATVTLDTNGNPVVTVNNATVPYIYAALSPYNVTSTGGDQTVQIQAALNAAAATGATVILPVGNLIVNGTGLVIPIGVNLVGAAVFFPTLNTNPGAMLGTVLVSPHASYSGSVTPMITMNSNTLLSNLVVYGSGDGFGAGTTRTGILLGGVNSHIFHTAIVNHFTAVECNFSGPTLESNYILQNGSGLTNCTNGQILNNTFAENGTNLDFAPGSGRTFVAGNHFDANGAGASVNIDGSFGNSTTASTNGTTAAANSTLHFASAPAGALQGYQIYNQTHPTVIPLGTYVTSAAPGTSITMSAAATGAGVASSDVIEFYVPGVESVTFSSNLFDTSFTNAIAMSYANHILIDGSNSFVGSGTGATANTSDDAHIFLSHTNAISIIGVNTTAAGTPITPSWGVWDAGANYGCSLRSGIYAWTPVNGVNGGGINVTTTFANFSTDNTVVRANPYIGGLP